jgi:hypothetical protein
MVAVPVRTNVFEEPPSTEPRNESNIELAHAVLTLR